MRFHHVGMAVRDLEKHAAIYRDVIGFSRRSRPIEVSAQGVRVVFIEIGPASFLELVQPIPPRRDLERYLTTGYYHACYLTADMDAALAKLRGSFILVRDFQSEAFAGKRCAFVANSEGHLIELAEMSVEAFQAFFESSLDP